MLVPMARLVNHPLDRRQRQHLHLNNNHNHIEQQVQPNRSHSSSSSDNGSPSQTQVNLPSSYTVPINANHYQMLMNGDTEGLQDDLGQDFNFSELVRESDNSRIALHIAVMGDQAELISFLLSRDSNLLDSSNSKQDRPIHVAVRAGHHSAVMALLNCAKQHQLNIRQLLESTDSGKNTALHIALENQQEEMARNLFHECPHTFYLLNHKDISPLYLAIKAGFWDLVKSMIENPEVDAGEAETHLRKGVSVLHAAIRHRNEEIFKAILIKYEDLIFHPADKKGRLPLSYAAYIGFLDGVKYFLDEFPNQAFKPDNDGSFPIHNACRGGNFPVVKEFLSRTPSTRRLLNNKRQNILHVAAASGQVEVVSYLLKQRDFENLINMKDEDGNTPLHLASEAKHPAVVYDLTWNKRVILNLQNKQLLTALDLAEKYDGEVPSFQERLTWMALRNAGVLKAPTIELDHEYMSEIPPTETETENENLGQTGHQPKQKNRYKDRLNTLLVVSTLVSTVTFSSGFTVPGGNYQDRPNIGLAILAQKRAFQVFVISNTIAMYSSILAVVTLIWAHLDDLRLMLLSLDFALPLLGISLTAMSIAYMAGLYVVLHSCFWLGIVVLVTGVVFLGALLVFLIPLYSPTSIIKYKILRYLLHLPFMFMLLACEKGKRQTLH